MTGLMAAALLLTGCNLIPLPNAGPKSTALRKDPRTLTFTPVKATLPEIQEFTTGNGIQVIFIENHELPLISVRAQLAGGSVYTVAKQAGLVNLFADVLRTGGAGNRSGDDLNNFLESRAASVETWGSQLSTGVNLRCLAEDFPDVLQVLGDIFTAPRFAPDKLELARNLRLDQVRRENDNPHIIINREFKRALYPDNILGVRPDAASYNSLTRSDLMAFWKKYYHPNNVIMAVTGDITRSDLNRALTRVFGKWTQATLDVPPVPKVADNPRYQVILVKKDLVQSSIRVGNLSPLSDTDPDRFAVSVMNYVLGAGGFKSRLVEKIRSDEGLAYSVWSGFSPGWKFPGVFQAGTETKAATTHRALEIMVREIKRMRDSGVTPDEFDHAKTAIINRDVFKYDEPSKIVNQLLTLKFEGKPQTYLTDAVKGYQSLTLEQVNAAAKKYLQPEKMILMVVGNPDLFEKPLDDFGSVTVIDLKQES